MTAREPTERDPLDFYPTPFDVLAALAAWIHMRPGCPGPSANMLDPAAGEGAIVSAMRGLGWGEAHWSAIEIHPRRFELVSALAEHPVRGDALTVDWHQAHVVMNPPFGLLDAFWAKAVRHRDAHGVWVACLTPVAWWCAEKRANYTEPDHILALKWRPSFRAKCGPAHKGSQDFCWSVLAPDRAPHCTWERLPKPSHITEQGSLFGVAS